MHYSLFAIFFGSPFAMLITAAGAVSLPVIIHLLNRKRFRVVPWAAMRFLLAAQKKNSRRLRIEQLLLLLLRILIVLLVILAMACVSDWAEDLWKETLPEGALLGKPGGKRTHRILVLDGSLSMGLKPGEASSFEKARGLAARIVTESIRGDGFSVILMASSPKRVTGSVAGPSLDAAGVLAELDSLRLPHGNSDLAGTLQSVRELLKHSPRQFSEREVYFLTDLQKTTWALAQPKQVTDALEEISLRARTIVLDVGVDEPPRNLAVTSLGLARDRSVALSSQKVVFSATVRNFGEATPEPVALTVRVGRAREKSEDPPFKFEDLPLKPEVLSRGETIVSFEHVFPGPGTYVVQFRLEADALDLDDSRSLVLRVRENVPVMLVNGKLAPERYDQAAEYLYDALNPYQGRKPPADAPLRPTKLSAAEFADAGLGDLSGFDCVFLCDVPKLDEVEVKRLEAHVLRGGGVVFCLGPRVNPDQYNHLLYRNGQGLLPAELKGVQRPPKGFHFQFAAEERDLKLPPLAVFERRESDRKNLFESPFYSFLRTEPASPGGGPTPRRVLSFITVPDKMEPGKPSESSTYPREPALLEWQPSLLREKDAGDPVAARRRAQTVPASRGRVALLTSTVNAEWTDWPRKGSFVWLMQELVSHVASARLRGQAAIVGETLEEYLAGTGPDEKDVNLLTPDGRRETVRTTTRDEAVLWRFADTDISGIYKATIGSHPREHLLAVNAPVTSEHQQASESDLARSNPEELQKLYPEWEFQVVRDPGDAVRRGAQSLLSTAVEQQVPQMGSAIARWILLLAFTLLVVEGVLAWYFGHYSAVHERELASRSQNVAGFRTVVAALVGLLAGFFLLAAFVLTHAVLTGDFLGFLSDTWRRSMEKSMKVPAPAPGEGTRWNLEFQPFLRDESADLWLVPLLGLAVAILVACLYRREGRVLTSLTPRRRLGSLILMAGLRMGLVIVLLAIVLPRLRLLIERESWPDIAIVIDDSASMSEVDRFRDPKVQEVADRLTRVAGLSKPQRLQLAQALLTRGDQDWLTRLLNERQVRIHIYRCSARADELKPVTQPGEIAEGIEVIQSLQAHRRHDSSQLGAAVRKVLNDFSSSSSLSAIIMLTDGVTTEGEDLVQVSKYAYTRKVPLFLVGVGDSHDSRDIILSDLEAADSVYVNDNLVFRFNVTAKGYGNQLSTVRVRLREKGGIRDLAAQDVNVDTSGKPVKVRLEYRPTTSGEKPFVIDTDVRPDEVDRENNRLEKTVWVSETQTIKILYVEGYGRWEFRYLKTLLERESDRLKNNKTMELNFWLQDADPQFAPQDKSARADLPGKLELNKYHVVILGDVDPNPQGDARMGQFLKDLADFVREKGGGLLMLSGERFSPHAYKDSPLRDVLSIDIVSDRPPDEPEGGRIESYRPELTAVGRMHPIFSFNEKDGEEVLRKLQPMYWHAEGIQPKRAAEVLAVHPTKKMPGAKSNENRLPLAVQHFVGEGRAMFLGFNETWRWRKREDEGRFNQFWIQAVRYLARAKQGRVELRLDRQTPYLRGEPIKVTVRFPDDDKPPPENMDVRVMVINHDLPEQRTMKLTRIDGSRATYEGILTQTPEGRYEFWLSKPTAKPLPKAAARVLALPGEMQKLQMNQPDMEAAARETRGQFYSLAEADRLIDDLPSGTRVRVPAPGKHWILWNHATVLLAILLFLGVEWVLRKRFHLL